MRHVVDHRNARTTYLGNIFFADSIHGAAVVDSLICDPEALCAMGTALPHLALQSLVVKTCCIKHIDNGMNTSNLCASLHGSCALILVAWIKLLVLKSSFYGAFLSFFLHNTDKLIALEAIPGATQIKWQEQ